jgi:hypothetical protein
VVGAVSKVVFEVVFVGCGRKLVSRGSIEAVSSSLADAVKKKGPTV